jgi:hypothetical protein
MCEYYSSRRIGQCQLRVGRIEYLVVTTYKRKRVGPKYQGKVLFMKVHQNTIVPKKVDNYYVCARKPATTAQYVRVEDMCTLLAEVDDREGDSAVVNLVPITTVFPISWIAE